MLLMLSFIGCGAAGGSHGGDHNLPTAGVHPFMTEEEPIVSIPLTDLRHPSIVMDGNEAFWIYVLARKDERSSFIRIPHVPGESVDIESVVELNTDALGQWTDSPVPCG